MNTSIINQLPETIVQGSYTLTQIKRTDRVAMYKREDESGNFTNYEIFATLHKNGQEFYPTPAAFGKWAWAPVSEERANTYYDRVENGDVVIPNVDPETSELIPLDNDPSLEELMAQEDVVSTPIPLEDAAELADGMIEEGALPSVVDEPTVEVSLVEEVVEAPKVEEVAAEEIVGGGTTPIESVVVETKVAKVRKPRVEKEYQYPTGEFTQAQFAVANGMPERGAVWGVLDKLVNSGKITKVLKQVGKGRPTQFFTIV